MSSESILVIAAHPDDEVLGCGATIATHAAKGDQVHVVILAEGLKSRGAASDQELATLKAAARAANAHLGESSLAFHNFPDNCMDRIDRLDVIKVVEEHIRLHSPHTVYTHHAGDVNIDHRRIHDAIVTACRPLPNHPVEQVLFFEVPSSTEWQPTTSAPYFQPNWFVDVTNQFSAKVQALKAYHSEMRP